MADSSVVKGQGDSRTHHSLDEDNQGQRMILLMSFNEVMPMNERATALPERFVIGWVAQRSHLILPHSPLMRLQPTFPGSLSNRPQRNP